MYDFTSLIDSITGYFNETFSPLWAGVLLMVLLGIAILAWLFVIARLFHALVHVTTNDVRRRGPVFGVGLIIVTLIWIFLAVELVTGAP